MKLNTNILVVASLAACLLQVEAACDLNSEITLTDDLPAFTTIVAAVEDVDCPAGVDATYNLPSFVDFAFYVNTEATNKVMASADNMVIPFVQDGALHFRWNPDYATSAESSDGTAAGIKILFDPVSITKIETPKPPATIEAFTTKIHIEAGWGALSQISNHVEAKFTVLHGGDVNTNTYPDWAPQDLTYQTTGSSGDLQLYTIKALGVDLAGSAYTAKVWADQGVSGTFGGESNWFKVSSDVPTTIVMEGKLNMLFVSELNEAGCDMVDVKGEANVCQNITHFDPEIQDTTCLMELPTTEVTCGSGNGSEGDSNSGAPLGLQYTVSLLLSMILAVTFGVSL